MVNPRYDPAGLIAPRFLRGEGTEAVVSANERAVLRLVRLRPGLSRSEINGRTALTQQSVHRIVEHLADRGLIAFGEPKPGAGRGHPSPTVHLDNRYAFTVGLSVNTDSTGITVMDLGGDTVTVSVDTDGLAMTAALDVIEDALSRLLESRGRDRERLFGIGFGISGFLTEGTRYNAPLPLHDWSLIELGPLLANRFGAPVWVDNGANTAAICEAMLGVGRYIQSFAYLSFNYGFGGGIVLNGELVRGGHGNAGELSGMYDNDEQLRRPALQFLMKRLHDNGVDAPSIEYVRHHFDPGWPGVADWLDEVTPACNRLVNALNAIVDPQAIVFGGQIPPALADMLIARIAFFNRPRYGVARRTPKLIVSELKDDPSAIGAAAMPFKAMLF